MQTGRAIMLRGLPSLLVPYGTRIPMNKRAACLGAIEEQLKRFLKAGYVYKESDLRWRHILFLGDGNDEKVFLADLGSLQTVPPSDRSDNSKVEEQMNYLKTHMVMEVDGGEDDGGDAKTESGKKRPQQPTGGSPASKKAKV
ncbi:expressed unknown protein [Seminavis robusta]|uniref:Uncharacterized protein n=1 Tax=Seminavis robusta TaxID=568900 RepID=A0A9N8HKZ6_9STRA|nr:expressed unknown protein [Seminavis robusta]|eukprot:Sro648_g181060.1 n/a (142) ;mRNA; r:30345-30770